jgi:hypothetical protein
MPAVLEPTAEGIRLQLKSCAVPIVYQILLVSFVGSLETREEMKLTVLLPSPPRVLLLILRAGPTASTLTPFLTMLWAG